MAARLRLLPSTDPVSPAVLPPRTTTAEVAPNTQHRHAILRHLGEGKRNRSCIRHAVAEAPPAQAPEALQLEVCFEAPPENYMPPTRIETSGRIIASASRGDLSCISPRIFVLWACRRCAAADWKQCPKATVVFLS
jgi:hypothetical protein